MDLTRLLRPLPLMIKRRGEVDQLLQDWEEYVYTFNLFLEVTEVITAHTVPEIAGTPCVACKETKI